MSATSVFRQFATLRRSMVIRSAPVTLRNSGQQLAWVSLPRSYATTTKGDSQSATSLGSQSPKASDSPEEGDIKSSRANEGASQEQGGSVSKPVSESTQSTTGADEEGGDPAKQDPNKPAAEKRKEVESHGNTPLDPANK